MTADILQFPRRQGEMSWTVPPGTVSDRELTPKQLETINTVLATSLAEWWTEGEAAIRRNAALLDKL